MNRIVNPPAQTQNETPPAPETHTGSPAPVWVYQNRISYALLVWNALNIVTGLMLSASRKPLNRGIGSQSVGWGVINSAIGLVGLIVSHRRRAAMPDPDAPEVVEKEAGNLRRLLAINVGLDALYVIGGSRMLNNLDVYRRGIGIGIMIQGAALFVWDMLLLIFFPSTRRKDE